MLSPTLHPYFHPLEQGDNILPSAFTFPFFYQPHPLAIKAAQQVQAHLLRQASWNHLFGLNSDGSLDKDAKQAIGKMFGVLLVSNPQGQLGYVRAFSGKINDSNHHRGFVPPVYDMLDKSSFFSHEMETLNRLHAELSVIEQNPEWVTQQQALAACQAQATASISHLQGLLVQSRAKRKLARQHAVSELSPQALSALKDELAKQSIAEKKALLALKKEWQQKTECIQKEVDRLAQQLSAVKTARAEQSQRLQQMLFAQYSFLSAQGSRRNLNEIFAQTPYQVPPAGAGECAAPKLLQYAYLNHLRPIALAEFWWGQSPKSEIRHHRQYYPACISKCQPILSHMLQGLKLEPNPLEQNQAADKQLGIIYQDAELIVVNKPPGMLSVPGKTIKDCAKRRVELLCPDVPKVYVLHRLDMATSGLLVFALSPHANKHLQQQFIRRQVQKSYVALLDGTPLQQKGEITLPLAADAYDLPRQKVDLADGKSALTLYQVLGTVDNYTKVQLKPETGRTHQLRVHCAHKQGLNTPIVGDRLYGKANQRLFLHAQRLQFTHPISKAWLSFEAEADF